MSLNNAMLQLRNHQLKDEPAEKVSQCMELLIGIDPRRFNLLSLNEKSELKNKLSELEKIIDSFEKLL